MDPGINGQAKKMGDGSIVHTNVVPNEKITATLSMGGEQSTYVQSFEEKNGNTIINWEFSSHLSFPKNIAAPFMKYVINKHNKQSIDNIEAEVKKRQKGSYFGYEVKEISQNPRHFVVARGVVSFDKMGQFYAQNLGSHLPKNSR